jgi:hypothetical protein
MARESKVLTINEFASLLAVGDAEICDPAPVISAAHSVRLIALGYMIHFRGRLRMTTPGRDRIAAGPPVDTTNSGWIGVLRLAGMFRGNPR